MGRIHRFDALAPGSQQRARDFPKPVPAVAHGQQLQAIPRPRRAPAARDGVRRGGGRQGAFELVGDDEHAQRHKSGYRRKATG